MDELYTKLRETLDHMGIGFPAVPGKDIPFLKKIFIEEHAKVFLAMENRFQPLEEIARRLGQGSDEVRPILEKMSDKGLVLSTPGTISPTFYHPASWLPGWGDWSGYYTDRETAELEYEYRKEAEFKGPGPNFKRNVFRTIPVYETIPNKSTTAPYDDARKIVEQAKKIALSDCYCDRHRIARGERPYEPLERCFSFNGAADHTVSKGFGRYISPEEAIEVLKKCADTGLVHNTGDLIDITFICNCGEHCGGNISRRNVPWQFEDYERTSNYYTTVDADACSGCEECVDRCWFDAISMSLEGVAEINHDVCEGCGLCVTICPVNALTLRKKADSKHYKPGSTHPNLKSAKESMKDFERYKDIIKSVGGSDS
jgi:ferredoxin